MSYIPLPPPIPLSKEEIILRFKLRRIKEAFSRKQITLIERQEATKLAQEGKECLTNLNFFWSDP